MLTAATPGAPYTCVYAVFTSFGTCRRLPRPYGAATVEIRLAGGDQSLPLAVLAEARSPPSD